MHQRTNACWVCGKRRDGVAVVPEEAAEPIAAMNRSTLPTGLANGTGSAELTHDTSGGDLHTASLCNPCRDLTRPYDLAWRQLSMFLHANWKGISKRGHFDLSRAFPQHTAALALKVHLYFVKLLGCKVFDSALPVDPAGFATALESQRPHAEVTLLVATCLRETRQLLYYDPKVSVLGRGSEVHSAVWMHL